MTPYAVRFETLPSRFMPLKTMRRIRFHKVAHGYLFGAPGKKIRVMRSRRKRPNPCYTKEAVRSHAVRRWGSRYGLESWYAAQRVQAVRELRVRTGVVSFLDQIERIKPAP